MVSHLGNPADGGRPYPISERAIDFLTKPRYSNGKYSGINFNGMVIVDDVSMRGIVDYVSQEKNLTNNEQNLLRGVSSLESKAAILALNSGVHAIIATNSDVGKIVDDIAYVYRTNSSFRNKVHNAINKYQDFVKKK